MLLLMLARRILLTSSKQFPLLLLPTRSILLTSPCNLDVILPALPCETSGGRDCEETDQPDSAEERELKERWRPCGREVEFEEALWRESMGWRCVIFGAWSCAASVVSGVSDAAEAFPSASGEVILYS